MVILNLSESLAKPLVMAKLNMAYLSSLKNRAKLPHCRCQKTEQRYGNFKLIRITCQAACHGKTEHGIFVKLKNRAKLPHCRCQKTEQRYGNFKLIRITCQAACRGKIKHGIFVKFKKKSKTASLPVSKNRAALW